MSTQRRSEPHPFVSYADASHICKHCDGGEFAACHQANTIHQQSRAVRNMPPVVTCDNCGLTYYQTSAPHVCAEWTTRENRTMNESEKFITTGVFRHERNTSGNCSVSGCPCRGWSAQEPVNEQEHEPVARGGKGEWRLEHVATNTRGTKTLFHRDTPVAIVGTETLNDHQRALDMTTALNQHHSLLAERERYAQLLRAAKFLLAMNATNYDREAMRSEGGFDALQKAVDAIDQKEGEG